MARKIKTKAKERTLKELKDAFVEARNFLSELKLDMDQKKLKNTRLVFWKRKEIARLLTEIRQKQEAEKGKDANAKNI